MVQKEQNKTTITKASKALVEAGTQKVQGFVTKTMSDFKDYTLEIFQKNAILKGFKSHITMGTEIFTTNEQTSIIIDFADFLDEETRKMEQIYHNTKSLVKEVKKSDKKYVYFISANRLQTILFNILKSTGKDQVKDTLNYIHIITAKDKIKFEATNGYVMSSITFDIQPHDGYTNPDDIKEFYINGFELQKIIKILDKYISSTDGGQLPISLFFAEMKGVTELNNKVDMSHCLIEAPNLLIHTMAKLDFTYPKIDKVVKQYDLKIQLNHKALFSALLNYSKNVKDAVKIVNISFQKNKIVLRSNNTDNKVVQSFDVDILSSSTEYQNHFDENNVSEYDLQKKKEVKNFEKLFNTVFLLDVLSCVFSEEVSLEFDIHYLAPMNVKNYQSKPATLCMIMPIRD